MVLAWLPSSSFPATRALTSLNLFATMARSWQRWSGSGRGSKGKEWAPVQGRCPSGSSLAPPHSCAPGPAGRAISNSPKRRPIRITWPCMDDRMARSARPACTSLPAAKAASTGLGMMPRSMTSTTSSCSSCACNEPDYMALNCYSQGIARLQPKRNTLAGHLLRPPEGSRGCRHAMIRRSLSSQAQSSALQMSSPP